MEKHCDIHIMLCRNVLDMITEELCNLYIYQPRNISRVCDLILLRDYYTEQLEDSLDWITQSYD